MDLGLKFITMERTFDFYSSDFSEDENKILNFGDNINASIFMKDFFEAFSTNIIYENDRPILQMEPYIQFTKERQTKISDFLNNYKLHIPKLNALEKSISSINENEYLCILPSWITIDTIDLFKIKDELFKLNNRERPKIKEFFTQIGDDYNLYHFEGDQNIKIGHKNREERICRWCNNTTHSTHPVTFKEKAHAISEALGNKNLILLDECDECNSKFAKNIEKDIINHFKLLNTIWGVRGKNGIPKIKFNDIEIENNEYEKRIEIKTQKLEVKNDKPVSVSYMGDKITKQNIYKALCKFALSLVEEKIFKEFSWTVDWINGKKEVEKVPIVKELFTYKFFPEYPVMQLYVRKNNNKDIPKLFGIFYHTNIVYLFIVPVNEIELNKFSEKENFNKFMATTPYNECKEWKDIDFSDNIERKTQIVLNFEQRKQK